jgi:hypothetical protein
MADCVCHRKRPTRNLVLGNCCTVGEKLLSKYPLRTLGQSQDGGLDLSEENRQAHIHILGSTREGKGKFLEMLLTQDMGNFGATLLDPSDNGATAYSVLKWAMAQGLG